MKNNQNEMHFQNEFSQDHQITITRSLFFRDDPSETKFYESPSWVSNGVWAVRKRNISNLTEFLDNVEYWDIPYIEKTNEDFFNITNIVRRLFHKTSVLVGNRNDGQNCLVRMFRADNGDVIGLNDNLVSGLQIETLTYGEKNKAFSTPDQAVIIMPFDSFYDVSIGNKLMVD